MSEFSQDGLDQGREALRRFLAGKDDLTAMLDQIVLLAVESVPSCDAASITMLRKGAPTTVASTHAAATAIDEAQYELGDGPCLSALRHRGTEHLRSAIEERWPPVVAKAREEGMLSTFSVFLGDEDLVLGSLNLYSANPAGFDEGSQSAGALFADQLGIAAANAVAYSDARDLAVSLQRAMESRATIEQAKGILVAAQRCTPTEAFDILVKASQRENRKLRTIAEEIVHRHTEAAARKSR